MMKKFLFTVAIFFAFVVNAFSQDYLDKIAQGTCSCVEKLPDTLATSEMEMKFGLCVIEVAMPYKKQLKKEHGINLDNIENEGESLGRLIGMRMITFCPNVIIKLSGKSDEETKVVANSKKASGVVSKIEKDFFVAFLLKDSQGKISKYYWLESVESEVELLTSYNTLQGQDVQFTYETKEFFDPRIDDYRAFNVISKIEYTFKAK